jgi:hypothetical protein
MVEEGLGGAGLERLLSMSFHREANKKGRDFLEVPARR